MSDFKDTVARAIEESIELRGAYRQHLTNWLTSASSLVATSLAEGGRIFIAGNGGSAADSQHFAAELVVRLTTESERDALPAVALTVDSSILTAAANDFGYENIFARQLKALARKGDVFIGLSTSGGSANVIRAFEVARDLSLVRIGLFGEKGLSGSSLCEVSLRVPAQSTMRIQEEHIFALHLLVQLIEQHLFGS
jgi:D-sedoheptulose 7-phosphate isomerase